MACPRGVGLPGRVWARGAAEWISNLGEDPSFLRAPAALRQGLQGAVAFPILIGAEVLGAMIFFSQDANRLDSEALHLFAAIGNQIGQFIERKRAEMKLAELARTLAADASALFARNLTNFLTAFWDKDKSALVLPDEDEIVVGIRLTRGGAVIHERLKPAQ